jgi:hypothetical protein
MTPNTSRPILTRLAFILLWLFVFTIPMTYATELPMIGTISRAAGLAAVIGGAIAVAARREIRLFGPVHLAMAAFILWSAVTLSWSVAPNLTVQRVETYLQLFVLVFLVWEMCTEEKDVLRILGAFVLGTIVPALSTLYGFLPGQQTMIQRASTPGYDANQLAFLLALSLPAAYFLILRDQGPVNSLYRLQMGFAVSAILLTGSASSMIAMAVGLSLACWTLHTIPVSTRNRAFAIVLLLAGMTLIAVPSRVWKGVVEQTRKGDITETAVLTREVESLHTTPIGGFGAGTQLRPAVGVSYGPDGRPTSFTVFAETGVVGVTCFLAVLGMLGAAAGRMSVINRSFWLTSLAVWIMAASSTSWDCSQTAWLIFGLLAAHAACHSAENAVKAERAQKSSYAMALASSS